MLKRIQIKNVRSCKDVMIDDLGPMTALVGRNAVGKTNLLRAIDQLGRVASANFEGNLSDSYLHDSSSHAVSAEIELMNRIYSYVGEWKSRTSRSETLHIAENGRERREVFSRHDHTLRFPSDLGPLEIGGGMSALPAVLAFLPKSNRVFKDVKPLIQFLGSIRYYPLGESTETPEMLSEGVIIGVEEYERWKSRYEHSGIAGHSVALRLIHMSTTKPSRLRELVALLGIDGLDLIHDIKVDKPADWADVFFLSFIPSQGQKNGSAPSCNYFELSLGTRRVLRLLTSVVFDGASVMLVEHPEDGIHAGLLRRLIPLLRKYLDPMQLILSSHSATVLNEFDPKDVRLVTMEHGATKVRAMTHRELKAAATFITESGGALADFLEPL